MTLVGSILKETTKVTSQISVKRFTSSQQEDQLKELLSKAKSTRIGKTFRYDLLLKAPNIQQAFAEIVPLYSYESFHREWNHFNLSDHKNITWPGKINFYALSSGTTSDTSKRIPVSDQMIRQFQRTTLEQILSLSQLNLPASFYRTSVLTLGGSTKLTSVQGHWEGDLSGILQKNKSILYKPFGKPGQKTAQLKDWNEKVDEIVRKAPRWDIGVVAGVPSWVCMTLERIIKHYRLNSIHDIWPNLTIYAHGGVFIDAYASKIEQLCGKPIFFQNTYLSSEGYFAYQKSPDKNSMQLLVNHGVYYEFIPEDYFPQIRNKCLHEIPTLTLDEVKENVKYALVVSTNAGLWRYVMGDVIQFTDKNDFSIKLLGRIDHAISMMGEHLSGDHIDIAIAKTAKELNIEVPEYCVYPSKQNDRHLWFIGVNQSVDQQLFAVVLNQQLEELNDDYCFLRKILIKAPKVKALPLVKFYEFMEKQGKIGAQHKFPRVLNKTQAFNWEAFLSCFDW